MPQIWNEIIPDNQHNLRKTEKSQSSFTWQSMEGDCNAYALIAVNAPIMRVVYGSAAYHLRSFGHQGALYYVFLASDSLKTSREYAVFTLRTRGPKSVHTQNLASNAKSKCVFVLVAPNDRIISYTAGKLAARTKFHHVLWKTKGLARMVTSKILCKIQKWGRSRPICVHIFALLVLNLE